MSKNVVGLAMMRQKAIQKRKEELEKAQTQKGRVMREDVPLEISLQKKKQSSDR